MPRDAAAVAHDLRTARERVEQLGSIIIGNRSLSELLEEAATALGDPGPITPPTPETVQVVLREGSAPTEVWR
jgi:hypothetical protein